MKQIYILVIILSFSLISSAQPFNSIANPFPGMARGAMAFVDFDNDNDLDLIMTGQDVQFLPMAKIFQNNNGSFVEAPTNITGLYNSALSVADFDHDGLMDVIITGQDLYNNKTYLYKNIGSFQFSMADSTLYAAGAGGDVAFGDYNNDGFADILLSGQYQSKIYYNDGNGGFVDIEADLPGMNYCSVAWGDYDNDGDKDILMAGDDGSTIIHVINNNQGAFSIAHTFDGAISGDACWGDHDQDGYLDFLFNGKDYGLVAIAAVYRNNSDNTFSNANAGFVGTALGPANWIDFDNDTDLDVMLAGQNTSCGSSFTALYTNNGVGGYDTYLNSLAFMDRSASAWGDYDNDGDWDFLLAGLSVTANRIFYRNDLITNTGFQSNTAPTVPVVTDIYSWGDYAVINWQRSSDLQSPQEAITYNLRVGSAPGASDILSADADIATGVRYIAERGNCGSNTFAIIRNLAPGTYYYSLQAIDQSYKGSQFSEELSFVILPTAVNDAGRDIPYSVRREGSAIWIQSSLKENYTVSLYSCSGVRLVHSDNRNANGFISTEGLATGLYIVHINSSQGNYSFKVVL